MDHNVQIILANVDHDCDGVKTDLIRFFCPSSIIEGQDYDNASQSAARYIGGLMHITDPTEWYMINTGMTPEAAQRIDPNGWWHHSGLDFQSVPGSIFR